MVVDLLEEGNEDTKKAAVRSKSGRAANDYSRDILLRVPAFFVTTAI